MMGTAKLCIGAQVEQREDQESSRHKTAINISYTGRICTYGDLMTKAQNHRRPAQSSYPDPLHVRQPGILIMARVKVLSRSVSAK
jgi:hypothetical protein